jgi:hypothetical protein
MKTNIANNKYRRDRIFRSGNLVSIRSKEEILASLDSNGAYEELPFMPEMVPFCGKTARIYRRADRTWVDGDGMRRLKNSVLLEGLRCNGSAHDDCQRQCLFFWKEAWLKASNDEEGHSVSEPERGEHIKHWAPTKIRDKYWCQSTALIKATRRLPWWNIGQYLKDLKCGQATYWQIARMILLMFYKKLSSILGIRFFASVKGKLKHTPGGSLNLQPGEFARLRSKSEIRATLDEKGKNRGLEFSPEMLWFCGHSFRVKQRIERMILENSGKMRTLENTVLLEGLTCDGKYHRGCSRNSYLMCREIWLRRL